VGLTVAATTKGDENSKMPRPCAVESSRLLLQVDANRLPANVHT
jgi:hypothetical protein